MLPHTNIYRHSSTLPRNFVITITKHISYMCIDLLWFLYGCETRGITFVIWFWSKVICILVKRRPICEGNLVACISVQAYVLGASSMRHWKLVLLLANFMSLPLVIDLHCYFTNVWWLLGTRVVVALHFCYCGSHVHTWRGRVQRVNINSININAMKFFSHTNMFN